MKKLVIAGGLLLTASLALVVWFLCAPYILMPCVALRDVRQPEALVLGKETGNPYTYGITIRGSGEIIGEASCRKAVTACSAKAYHSRLRAQAGWASTHSSTKSPANEVRSSSSWQPNVPGLYSSDQFGP